MLRRPSSHSPESQQPLLCLAWLYQVRSIISQRKKIKKESKIKKAIRVCGNEFIIFQIPIKSFKILLLSNFKKYLHWVSIVINFSKSRQVLLNFIPFTSMHFLLKVFHVKEKAWFLLKPTKGQFSMMIKVGQASLQKTLKS